MIGLLTTWVPVRSRALSDIEKNVMNLSSKNSKRLPAPDERPGSVLVIYDGDCQFCTAQVRRLNAWDSQGKLSFLSLHDPEVSARFPDLTHEALMKEMYVIAPDGRRFAGANGFRYLTLILWRLWPLAPILNFPGLLPVWSWGYQWVARQRYRWNKTKSCDNGSCEVHFRK